MPANSDTTVVDVHKSASMYVGLMNAVNSEQM